MTFARPDLLPWLWALSAIPLLYLVRRRARLRRVPHLFVWARVFDPLHRTRRRRLRDLASIALQMAIGASLLLAWAGPQRESTSFEVAPIEIYVDTSRHMAAGTVAGRRRIDAAMELIRSLIGDLPRDTEVTLLAAAEQTLVINARSSDSDVTDAALSRWPAPSGRLDVDELVDELDRRAAIDASTSRVFVSDFAFADADDLDCDRHRLGVAVVDADLPNAGLTSFAGGAERGGSAVAEFEISSFGGDAAGELVIVDGNDRELSRLPFVTAGDAATTVRVEVPARAGDWLVATIERRDGVVDAHADDDRIDWPVRRASAARVLVVSDAVDPHLVHALAAIDDVCDRGAAAVVSPTRWREAAGYDLVILDRVREERPLPGGNYLLLDATAPGLAFEYREVVDQVEPVVESARSELIGRLDPRELQIDRAHAVRVTGDLDVLLDSANGPLVWRGSIKDVRFTALSFAVSAQVGTLPMLPAWPLLLRRLCLDAVASALGLPPAVVAAGGSFAWPAARGGSPPMIRSLDDDTPFSVLRSVGAARWAAPPRAGRYESSIAAEPVPIGVAVIDREASDATAKVPGPDRPSPPIQRRRTTRQADQTPWFLVAAALLIALEWGLHAGGRTR